MRTPWCSYLTVYYTDSICPERAKPSRCGASQTPNPPLLLYAHVLVAPGTSVLVHVVQLSGCPTCMQQASIVNWHQRKACHHQDTCCLCCLFRLHGSHLPAEPVRQFLCNEPIANVKCWVHGQ